MKTTRIFSAISMVMIFATATASFGNNTGKVTVVNPTSKGIQHHVNIVIDNEQTLCNTYLVEIRDGKGQLVAPVQVYVSGVSNYDFFERGPATGVRIASLVRATFGHHYICEIELFTKPAFIYGKFLNGQVYRYDLFPSSQPNKE